MAAPISAVQTLPTPPSNEAELSKSYPMPSREEHTIQDHSASNSLLAARRPNVSLPAFTFPSPNQRSFNFSMGHPAPSLLTPPPGSDGMSPVEGGNAPNTSYWTSSSATQPSSSYTYSTAASSHPSYTTAPPLTPSPAYPPRGILSPISTSSRGHPVSPGNHDPASANPVTSGFDSNSYSAAVSVAPHTSQSYASSYPFPQQTPMTTVGSHATLGSPHDPYSPPSSLPPPTPSQGYYSQASSYPYHHGHSLSIGPASASISRPATASSLSHLHPVHTTPALTHSAYATTQQRYLPSGVPSSIYAQHGASVMTGGLGAHLAPHLHPSQHSHASVPHQERPFRCDQCPQSFNRNHDLKRHKRIHLAVKPFPCPNCDKSFSRKDALKRHVLVKGCGNATSNSKTTSSS